MRNISKVFSTKLGLLALYDSATPNICTSTIQLFWKKDSFILSYSISSYPSRLDMRAALHIWRMTSKLSFCCWYCVFSYTNLFVTITTKCEESRHEWKCHHFIYDLQRTTMATLLPWGYVYKWLRARANPGFTLKRIMAVLRQVLNPLNHWSNVTVEKIRYLSHSSLMFALKTLCRLTRKQVNR